MVLVNQLLSIYSIWTKEFNIYYNLGNYKVKLTNDMKDKESEFKYK